MKTIAFFNNKGGVGKTTLVYHLAHIFADLGVPTLAVDLDPQFNLSAMCLSDERLQDVWREDKTIIAATRPIVSGVGDLGAVHVEPIAERLHLIVGDLRLSSLEDQLAESWGKCLAGDERAFRVMSAFHRLIRQAADRLHAEIVLIDLGPNLGALNRAALLAAQHLVLPIGPDLFSLQGLENLGPTLRHWRKGWEKRREELPAISAPLDLPDGLMAPVGYVVLSFGVRDNRPVKAYDRWIQKMPGTYRHFVLDEPEGPAPSASDDPYRLGALKHYRSLMPLAMEANKPMFALKSADGAIGSHIEAVRGCYRDFFGLATRIGQAVGLAVGEWGA